MITQPSLARDGAGAELGKSVEKICDTELR